jgi:hypothetical protein
VLLCPIFELGPFQATVAVVGAVGTRFVCPRAVTAWMLRAAKFYLLGCVWYARGCVLLGLLQVHGRPRILDTLPRDSVVDEGFIVIVTFGKLRDHISALPVAEREFVKSGSQISRRGVRLLQSHQSQHGICVQ